MLSKWPNPKSSTVCSVHIFQVSLCRDPKFLGQRSYNSRDFQPAVIQVKWPMVVVVPKKRGRATAVVLDASKNFDLVGWISDDQVNTKSVC
jgi:hypothetical protein